MWYCSKAFSCCAWPVKAAELSPPVSRFPIDQRSTQISMGALWWSYAAFRGVNLIGCLFRLLLCLFPRPSTRWRRGQETILQPDNPRWCSYPFKCKHQSFRRHATDCRYTTFNQASPAWLNTHSWSRAFSQVQLHLFLQWIFPPCYQVEEKQPRQDRNCELYLLINLQLNRAGRQRHPGVICEMKKRKEKKRGFHFHTACSTSWLADSDIVCLFSQGQPLQEIFFPHIVFKQVVDQKK